MPKMSSVESFESGDSLNEIQSEKPDHICLGKLGDQIYGGETWGCGKAFRRGHMLSAHYVSEEEGFNEHARL